MPRTPIVIALGAGLCLAALAAHVSVHGEPVAGSLVGAGAPGAAVGATTVHCEPVPRGQRTGVVQRQERGHARWIPASKPAAPKMKRVCKYVPVKPVRHATVAAR